MTITGKNADLLQLTSEFMRDVPWGFDLVERLRRDQVEVTYLRRGSHPCVWLLRVLLPDHLQERFGAAPEVLLLAVRNVTTKAQNLKEARHEILNSSGRLDRDLLIVVDDQPDLKSRLDRLPGWDGQRIALDSGSGGLIDAMNQQLPLFDVFDRRDPVRGNQVIGRSAAVRDLSTRITRGASVGVLGLRKVGKTTLVRAATDTLDPISAFLTGLEGPTHVGEEVNEPPTALVTWLDISVVVDRTSTGVVGRLATHLAHRLQYAGVQLPKEVKDPILHLHALLRAALSQTDLPICIVLDEFDYLFEPQRGGRPLDRLGILFAQLRGLAQQTGRLSVVLIGRDASRLNAPRLDGLTNPILSWFVSQWVGPLLPNGATELLRKLGKRVRLQVGPESSSEALRWTGGHPLLHRLFGSALLAEAQSTPSQLPAQTDALLPAAVWRFKEHSDVRALCAEVVDLLESRYTSAATLLRSYAVGDYVAVERAGGWRSDAGLNLRNFGLLTGSEANPNIAHVFQWYLSEIDREEPVRAAS